VHQKYLKLKIMSSRRATCLSPQDAQIDAAVFVVLSDVLTPYVISFFNNVYANVPDNHKPDVLRLSIFFIYSIVDNVAREDGNAINSKEMFESFIHYLSWSGLNGKLAVEMTPRLKKPSKKMSGLDFLVSFARIVASIFGFIFIAFFIAPYIFPFLAPAVAYLFSAVAQPPPAVAQLFSDVALPPPAVAQPPPAVAQLPPAVAQPPPAVAQPRIWPHSPGPQRGRLFSPIKTPTGVEFVPRNVTTQSETKEEAGFSNPGYDTLFRRMKDDFQKLHHFNKIMISEATLPFLALYYGIGIPAILFHNIAYQSPFYQSPIHPPTQKSTFIPPPRTTLPPLPLVRPTQSHSYAGDRTPALYPRQQITTVPPPPFLPRTADTSAEADAVIQNAMDSINSTILNITSDTISSPTFWQNYSPLFMGNPWTCILGVVILGAVFVSRPRSVSQANLKSEIEAARLAKFEYDQSLEEVDKSLEEVDKAKQKLDQTSHEVVIKTANLRAADTILDAAKTKRRAEDATDQAFAAEVKMREAARTLKQAEEELEGAQIEKAKAAAEAEERRRVAAEAAAEAEEKMRVAAEAEGRRRDLAEAEERRRVLAEALATLQSVRIQDRAVSAVSSTYDASGARSDPATTQSQSSAYETTSRPTKRIRIRDRTVSAVYDASGTKSDPATTQSQSSADVTTSRPTIPPVLRPMIPTSRPTIPPVESSSAASGPPVVRSIYASRAVSDPATMPGPQVAPSIYAPLSSMLQLSPDVDVDSFVTEKFKKLKSFEEFEAFLKEIRASNPASFLNLCLKALKRAGVQCSSSITLGVCVPKHIGTILELA
jgi:hypothetical protein